MDQTNRRIDPMASIRLFYTAMKLKNKSKTNVMMVNTIRIGVCFSSLQLEPGDRRS